MWDLPRVGIHAPCIAGTLNHWTTREDPHLNFFVVFGQSLCRVQLFAVWWTAACQASLYFTVSWGFTNLQKDYDTLYFYQRVKKRVYNFILIGTFLTVSEAKHIFPCYKSFVISPFCSVSKPCLILWPPWTAACQVSLSVTISQSLLRLMSIELVMPCNYLILCCPLLLLPSVFPSIRVFFWWVSSSHQVAKVLELQLQHQSFQWIFRTDFL